MRKDRYDITLLNDDICVIADEFSYGTLCGIPGLHTNIPHSSKDNELVGKLCKELHEKILEIRKITDKYKQSSQA